MSAGLARLDWAVHLADSPADRRLRGVSRRRPSFGGRVRHPAFGGPVRRPAARTSPAIDAPPTPRRATALAVRRGRRRPSAGRAVAAGGHRRRRRGQRRPHEPGGLHRPNSLMDMWARRTSSRRYPERAGATVRERRANPRLTDGAARLGADTLRTLRGQPPEGVERFVVGRDAAATLARSMPRGTDGRADPAYRHRRPLTVYAEPILIVPPGRRSNYISTCLTPERSAGPLPGGAGAHGLVVFHRHNPAAQSIVTPASRTT